jgi:hypothetical protein
MIKFSDEGVMRQTDNDMQMFKAFREIIPNNCIFAEVGCYAGESTKQFLLSRKIVKYYAIDIWNLFGDDFTGKIHLYPMETVERWFDENVKEFGDVVIKLKKYSIEAISTIDIIDVAYVDANHDYISVINDVSCIWPKVRGGGIISGHDFNQKSVKQAVMQIFNRPPDRIFMDNSWLYFKE